MKETLKCFQISTSLQHCSPAFQHHILSNSLSSPFQLPLTGLSPLNTLLHVWARL